MLARWTSDAAASDALLAEWHRLVLAGEDPGRALHGARAAIRRRPEWAAPLFWAGWMMMGK
jgi:CHAT domain-containing protein